MGADVLEAQNHDGLHGLHLGILKEQKRTCVPSCNTKMMSSIFRQKPLPPRICNMYICIYTRGHRGVVFSS